MNLETLKLYCDIVRLQSFSKGAKVNQVTQSAASQAIAQLEQDLGLQLIDRSKRPFALSPEGQKYYAGVRSVLSDYAKLVSEVKGAGSDIGGTVRVAAIYSVGLYDLSRYTQRFMSNNPQAKVRLEYLRPNKVYDAVVHEDADLGIMSYPRADRAVTVLPWRFEKMVFVCNPTHRLAARSSVTPKEFAGENFIGFDPDLPIRKAIDRGLKQQHSHVNIVMEFDNIETMKQAIEVNAGVSILPEPTVRREVEARRIVAIPMVGADFVRPVGIIHRRNKAMTPTILTFVKLLRADQPVAGS